MKIYKALYRTKKTPKQRHLHLQALTPWSVYLSRIIGLQQAVALKLYKCVLQHSYSWITPLYQLHSACHWLICLVQSSPVPSIVWVLPESKFISLSDLFWRVEEGAFSYPYFLSGLPQWMDPHAQTLHQVLVLTTCPFNQPGLLPAQGVW